jgi:putative methyltransferase (TIGR04325 family)
VNTLGSLKRLIAEVTPPILLRFCKSVLPTKRMLSGNYGTWKEALAHSSGYDNPLIVDRVRAALVRVKKGEKACERDSVVFDTKQYFFPVLAALLRAALNAEGTLKVLDYGGSLGSSYFLYRDILKPARNLDWHIVEQAAFVEIGKREFENDELRFFGSHEESLGTETPDIVLFSSVLQYLEHPHSALAAILEASPGFVLIDRTPFHEGVSDMLAVQNVPTEIYKASYPSWIFGARLKNELAKHGFRALTEWDCDEGAVKMSGFTARYRGLLLENAKAGRP